MEQQNGQYVWSSVSKEENGGQITEEFSERFLFFT